MVPCNGARFRFEAGGAVCAGRRLYVGDGPHGIHPVVRPAVVACERTDGGRVSPWAFTPEFWFAAKMVTLNMVVFWSAVLGLF